MSYTWYLVFSCSIFLAAGMGCLRFRRIAPDFRPFLICLWIGAVNEVISIYLAYSGYPTYVNNNIYVLAEALLLCWQAKRWGSFDTHPYAYPVIMGLFLAVWLMENIVFSSVTITSSWFRVIYSFIIVLIAIQLVNRTLISERRSLLLNPVFMICMGLILYFTFKGLVEICWISGISSSPALLIKIYSVMVWVNLLANIIYLIAVLCMPPKLRFTLPW